MQRSHRLGALVAIVVTITVTADAQVGGKLVVGGNPTPGTEQPEPPNLADRITIAGCLQAAPKANDSTDANTPSDARYALANAERIDRVPAGTGGSPAASSAASPSYRLMGIESQFTAFVGMKVEVSGEIKPAPSTDPKGPTLIVEFIQKLASSCK